MANNYNQYRNNGKGNYQNQNSRPVTPAIAQPLAVHYADKAELYLEGGIAYKQAEKFKFIAPHQLRKYLDTIKDCAETAEFEAARNKLYSVVPMAAYNAGRDRNQGDLYDFIRSNINRNSITSKKDIEVLDDLFTSIIAYHKYLSGK